MFQSVCDIMIYNARVEYEVKTSLLWVSAPQPSLYPGFTSQNYPIISD
jgi:hypothetical protein